MKEPITAREWALHLLHEARTQRRFLADLLDDVPIPSSERKLVLPLTLGLVRRQGTLDFLLSQFSRRTLDAVEPRVLDLLRIGAYQLLFLDGIPPHAAVHETVELAHFIQSPLARGFVNGILRRIAELPTSDALSEPGPSALPREDGQYRRLTRPVFRHPGEHPVAYLATAFSWPGWLAERWFQQHGFAEAARLGFLFNATPPLWLRVNRRETTRGAFLATLAAAGIDAEPGDLPEAVR
ncbi:MAG: transcription antitermination factor NusB, partial [Gemmataceae bacterium]